MYIMYTLDVMCIQGYNCPLGCVLFLYVGHTCDVVQVRWIPYILPSITLHPRKPTDSIKTILRFR